MKKLLFLMLGMLFVSTVPMAFSAVGDELVFEDDRTLDSPVFLASATENTVDLDQLELLQILESPLAPSKQSFELSQRIALSAQEEPQVDEFGNYYVERPEGWLHPGKATLLSALIPGAGELYAGSYIKSALFFAIEIGCWVGAINYGIRGDEKDTEFKKFADTTWSEDIYREYEFWMATNFNTLTESVDPPFGPPEFPDADESTWLNLSWEQKMRYLPDWFTHDLPSEKTQQYYEMIGKYLQQFGVGWPEEYENHTPDDVFQPNAYYSAVGEEHWYGFGVNTLAKTYTDMRYDSNTLLEMRDNFFKIVMINHVLSALDAGFTVARHNRRLMEAQFGAETRLYNGEMVAMGKIKINW